MAASERAGLVEELRTNGAWAESVLRGTADERWAEGRYERGWNAKQILAHVAAIEWTYPRLLEVARAAGTAGGGREPAAAPARGGIDEYNRRQVEKREGAAVGDLIDEMMRNRAALIEAVQSADDELFDVEIRSAGGRSGTLARVLREVAIEHVRGHVQDIADDQGTAG